MAEPEVFMDLNKEYPKGTTAIRATAWDRDGKFFAYALSHAGSDWVTIKVRSAEGEDLPEDVIEHAKFSGIEWLKDGSGFFYSRYPASDKIKGAEERLKGYGAEVPSGGEGADASGAAAGGAGEGEAGGQEGDDDAAAEEEEEVLEQGTETDANENQFLCFHRLHTPQSEDVVVFRTPEHPLWRFSATVSDESDTLLVSMDDGCDPVNRLFYADLKEQFPAWLEEVRAAKEAGADPPLLGLVKAVDNFDALYQYLGTYPKGSGSHLFYCNKDAPRNKIVRITLPPAWKGGAPTEPTREQLDKAVAAAEEVVPQAEGPVVLESASLGGGPRGWLLLKYAEDCKHKCYVQSLEHPAAARFEVPLPDAVSVYSFSTSEPEDDEVFFQLTSFVTPAAIRRMDLSQLTVAGGEPGGEQSIRPADGVKREIGASGDSTFLLQRVYDAEVPGFDADDFVSEQLWAEAEDGVKVPYFVTRSKKVAESGKTAPTILYGYGGFNISINPYFSPFRLAFLQKVGGAFVVANIRGGGEFGVEWHKAGSLRNKQRSYDDFFLVNRDLVRRGISTHEQIASLGGSNGGLLTLATMLQQPQLFGCVVSQVPVTMVTFHKHTIGSAWCSDFGDPDKEEDLEYMLRYFPLHNVKPTEDEGRQLPPTLIMTADHDDRVVPCHSLKMLAELQHTACKLGKQTNPLIGRIEIDAGHGSGKPTSMVIQEAAEMYAFIATYTGGAWAE